MNIQDISGQTPDSLKKKKQLTYLLGRSTVCLVNMSPYLISLSTRETDIYVIVPDLRHVVSKQQPLLVNIAWHRALHQIKCKEKPLWRNSWRGRKIVEIGNKKRFFTNRDTPFISVLFLFKGTRIDILSNIKICNKDLRTIKMNVALYIFKIRTESEK